MSHVFTSVLLPESVAHVVDGAVAANGDLQFGGGHHLGLHGADAGDYVSELRSRRARVEMMAREAP